jgi:hypothetical protein
MSRMILVLLVSVLGPLANAGLLRTAVWKGMSFPNIVIGKVYKRNDRVEISEFGEDGIFKVITKKMLSDSDLTLETLFLAIQNGADVTCLVPSEGSKDCIKVYLVGYPKY